MKRSARQTIIIYYCIIWYALLIFKWSNDMLLYQQQPLFIYNTFDVFSWIFMQTGIQHWLLQTKSFLLFDVLYYSAPVTLLIASYKKAKWISWAAVYVLLVNWVYLQCYFIFPISSYTIFICWLLFPGIFIAGDDKTFSLLLDGLRYFFLYFFVSAGIWKFVNGGIFNRYQFSNILLEQHKEMLTNSPHYWLTSFYQWLILHPPVSYFLYVGATVMELSFVIGFFTKKFDVLLLVVYLTFLFADYFFMRIPYFETLPFLLTLYVRHVNVSGKKS